jgi:uncharacterized phiE125 gp8 family phage protein
MTINLVKNTDPIEEPVSLAEAKLHLRIGGDPDASPAETHPDDSLILALVKTSRRWCEAFQNRAYVTQTWDLYLDKFPVESFIELPKPPLQSLVVLTYKDSAGAAQTVSFVDPSGTVLLETDNFIVDTTCEPGRLCLKNGKSWPTALLESKSIEIEFVAGYGLAEDVPEDIKTAIKMALSCFYENRGDAEGNPNLELVKLLLWPDRIVPV